MNIGTDVHERLKERISWQRGSPRIEFPPARLFREEGRGTYYRAGAAWFDPSNIGFHIDYFGGVDLTGAFRPDFTLSTVYSNSPAAPVAKITMRTRTFPTLEQVEQLAFMLGLLEYRR